MKNYTVVLTIDEGFSPHTVGEALEAALKTLPTEPFGYSFDPFWAGKASVTLQLVWGGAPVGVATIRPLGTVEEVQHVQEVLDTLAEDLSDQALTNEQIGQFERRIEEEGR